MSYGHSLLKVFSTIGLILTLGASTSADAGILGFGNTMSWKEEVLLHDGQIITSERFYNLGGRPTLDSRERAVLDETVTFSLPGKMKEIKWRTDFRDSEPEPNSLNLLLLDVIKGVPYIATYPAGCIAYNKWKRPNPPYILFKYEGDEWKRISLAEFPPELNKTNVIIGRPATSLLKPYYTADQVDKENYDIHQLEYKTILREPQKNAGAGCPAMISYGKSGGWIGLDWFSNQPSLDACLKFCDYEKVSAETCPCASIFKGK